MTEVLFLFDTARGSSGWEWKDLLTALGVVVTAIVSVYTIKLSRKTTLETSESTAYARADKINEAAFSRLEREVANLRVEGERREQRHQAELEHRDDRITELEIRLSRSELRVEQLAGALRDRNLPVPPAPA